MGINGRYRGPLQSTIWDLGWSPNCGIFVWEIDDWEMMIGKDSWGSPCWSHNCLAGCSRLLRLIDCIFRRKIVSQSLYSQSGKWLVYPIPNWKTKLDFATCQSHSPLEFLEFRDQNSNLRDKPRHLIDSLLNTINSSPHTHIISCIHIYI